MQRMAAQDVEDEINLPHGTSDLSIAQRMRTLANGWPFGMDL